MRADGNLITDLARETARSWKAMSPAGKLCMVVGMVAWMVLPGTGQGYGVNHPFLAALRVAALVVTLYGVIDNARCQDEFYARVHLEACAFAVIVSSVLLYAFAEYGVDLGTRAVSVIAGVWVVGFVVAFARLRRA